MTLSETNTVYEFGERDFKEIVSRDVKDPTGVRRYLEMPAYYKSATEAAG